MSLADASAAAKVVLGVIVNSTERAAGTAAVACIFSCTICTSGRRPPGPPACICGCHGGFCQTCSC